MLDRRFLDSLPISAYRCTVEGHVLTISAAARACLGPRIAKKGAQLSDFYTEPGAFQKMAAILAEHGKVAFRAPMRSADGSVFWAEHHAVLRDDPKLGHQIIDGTFLDVTKLVEAERNRDNALLTLKSLIDNTPGVAIQIYSQDGTVQLWNPACEELYGYSNEEMIGSRLPEVLSAEEREHFEGEVAHVLQTRTATKPSAWQVRRKDKGYRYVWSTMFPIFTGKGMSIGCMDVDITERHDALERSEISHRQLAESEGISHVGSWEWLIETDSVYWSEELCRICGVPYEEEPCRTYEDFIAHVHPEDRERVIALLKKALESRASFSFEHRMLRPDGSVRTLLSRGKVASDPQGKPSGLFGTVQDLTEIKLIEKALAESEERHRLLAEHSHDLIELTDLRGAILYTSPSHRTVLGHDPDDLACGNLFDLVHPDDTAPLTSAVNSLLESGKSQTVETRLRRSDGAWLEFEVVLSGIATTGLVDRFLVAARNISERKTAERALRDSEERYRTLFERNLAGVYRTTVDGRILDVNDACARIFGFGSREELMAHNAIDFYFDPAERESTLRRLRVSGSLVNIDYPFRRPDGTTIWALESVTLFPGPDDASSVLEGTLIDITDRKRAEDEIVRQAHEDALTGLPNRLLFRDRLSLALAHAKRNGLSVAILFLDLDHFKLINDTLGHSVGDLVLKGVAARLLECVREEDTVARVGGDEFTLLIPEIARVDDADTVARKLLERLTEPFSIQGHELFITGSIGIAVYPNDGVTPETLLRNADSAMYRAKELGRNTAQMCTPAMSIRALERLGLENGIRHALERDELVLHYQPIVDLATGKAVAVEALLRWNHPERGLLQPADFIGIAEESRLIVPVGEWVLQTACRQLGRWKQEGFDTRMAINLSPRQFQSKDLPSMIQRILREEGVSPHSIDLEITETAAMQNADLTIGILRELTGMGIGIVIDDFGTGYSSLSYLKRFPIHALKIDRTFVHDLATTKSDLAIVTAVIATATALGLRVVAEGVETNEQLRMLESLHCNEAQGFLIGRPLPPSEFIPRQRPLTRDVS